MKRSKTKAIFTVMLLLLVAFVPMGSVQAGGLSDSSDVSNVKQVEIELDQKEGILVVPTDSDTIKDLSTTKVSETAATASFSGTIDENNFVSLEGTITLDGKKDKVKLIGEATQVFIGWDIPEGAKPIYTEVANMTMTRYEGATEMYATYVNVNDKAGKYNLHGEFYEDGHGGFVGTVDIDGKECQIGLLGNSMSMYESITPTIETKSYEFISVPQRSQWELYWDGHGYDAASRACGETTAAMLEEYWSSNHPDIWDIWVYNGYDNMNTGEAQDYLDDQGIYLQKGIRSGTLSYTIGKIEDMIDAGRPFYLTEESRWGARHAVVLRGYSDASSSLKPYFKLNDPNTLNGATVLYWYESDYSYFNYEENVYESVGSSDTTSTGYSFLG
ncbi:MAG: C39 family peptidase [Methanolobus sp.]|nr:C39 family peptidase [Methanolobus sp.]